MLYLRFRKSPETIITTSLFFDLEFENEWLENDLVKRMILDIDKSTVITGRVIESPILGTISPRELSGGVKTLILLLFEPKHEYYGTACGDNCAKWILEIAKIHDIHLAYENIMSFPEPFEINIVNNGIVVHDMLTLIKEEDALFTSTIKSV